MPLPAFITPTYKLNLPSSGKEINYRPFIVKEEKLLLLALESSSNEQVTTAIKTIIKNCVLTKGVKLESLPIFDIEYIFLNIRAQSVGEEVELIVYCPDDGETEVKIKIDLEDVKVKMDPEHTNKIKLNDSYILELRYPSLDQFLKNNFDVENLSMTPEQAMDYIIDCIDKLYDAEEVYTFSDYTKDEWSEFLNNLNSSVFKGIEKFFETMPKLSHEIEITNPKTEVKSTVTLEGLSSFFAS
jgi:hypothetical protein